MLIFRVEILYNYVFTYFFIYLIKIIKINMKKINYLIILKFVLFNNKILRIQIKYIKEYFYLELIY
jgi:hypothetical protein